MTYVEVFLRFLPRTHISSRCGTADGTRTRILQLAKLDVLPVTPQQPAGEYLL